MAKLVEPVTVAVRPARIPQDDHDAGDPQPRADLLHDHIAGHLEDEIAPVEGADGEPKRGRGHAEIIAHRQAREAHIDPIDIGEDIRQNRER